MSKQQGFFHSKANQFVIKILLAYGLWKLLYLFLTHGPVPVTEAWNSFTFSFGVFCASLSGHILNWVGETNFTSGIHILFDRPAGRYNMAVAEHCLAIPAMFLFTAIILSFPGPGRQKAWFIPLGLLAVFLINIARLVFLCLIYVNYPYKVFHFFHNYVYLVITYALIVLLVAIWMNRFAFPKQPNNIMVE